MIHVELVGGEEYGSGTYTATAETEASIEGTEAADGLIQSLTEGCAQQLIDAVDAPRRIEAVTVTFSPDDEVPPALEERLAGRWDIDDVSVRYDGEA